MIRYEGRREEMEYNRLCDVADAVLATIHSAGPEGALPAQLFEQPGCPDSLHKCEIEEIATATDFLFRLGLVVRC